MTTIKETDLDDVQHGLGVTASVDKVYEKPVLLAYGDVRDVTLGPTIGGGESSCAAVFKNGPGGCP